MTSASTDHPSKTHVRLQYVVRRLTMRRKFSATSLAIAMSAITLKTRRKYNIINSQCERMPDIHSLPEEVERPQADLKIVAMLTHGTDSAISTYSQLPLSPSHRYISTKQGRSANERSKYQRAKHIKGLIYPRKSIGCLQP